MFTPILVFRAPFFCFGLGNPCQINGQDPQCRLLERQLHDNLHGCKGHQTLLDDLFNLTASKASTSVFPLTQLPNNSQSVGFALSDCYWFKCNTFDFFASGRVQFAVNPGREVTDCKAARLFHDLKTFCQLSLLLPQLLQLGCELALSQREWVHTELEHLRSLRIIVTLTDNNIMLLLIYSH